ncbi:MAG: restriction endonuclease subunit S, partial [Tannerellaceae bacterium]|nr:restriction endonuclease subunit S [Tannerellaceae bacterium]
YLSNISPGGAGRNRVMNKKDFLKIVVFIPSLPEQQKIATFLSAIDKQIEGVSKQIDVMKEWKKGLLQQMFV